MLAILSFDVDAESPILVDGLEHADNAGVMSHQAYGPLVGVPRILDLLADYDVPSTFFVPGLTADRYPQTVERILEAGHEVGHHSYAHVSPIDQSEADERADFEHADNAGVMSHQAYGPLVGVPRILDLLAEYDVPSTFFVPGLTADRYPQTVERILEAGHEVGHHSYAHVSPIDQSEADERADFERALEALDRRGVRPEGFRCPSWEPTWRTPALVAEHGLAYDSSLMDADRPYLLETTRGEVVELPVHWSLDDWQQYAFLPRPQYRNTISSPQKVLDLWTSELDAMRRYDCLFVLTCHPFLSGRPHRVEVLRRLIEHALEAGDVEFVSCVEAARRARADDGLQRRKPEPVVVDESIYPG